MKAPTVLMISLAFFANLMICQPTKAEQVCKVTDPTGTPLNVRKTPNGEVINALRNQREVYILRTDFDNKGRAWVLVAGYDGSDYRTWGWVIREFISCYSR